jgi:hypothetical protein
MLATGADKLSTLSWTRPTMRLRQWSNPRKLNVSGFPAPSRFRFPSANLTRFPGPVSGSCVRSLRSPRSTAFPPVPPSACAVVRGFLRYYAAVRLPAAGGAGTSWFPCIELPCMHGVCDPAEPDGFLRCRFRPYCLPLRLTASALQFAFFEAQYPACMCPCQRFTPHLAMRRA